MPHLVYSPIDLAHTGVALPASVGGATPNTGIIRLGDATKMTVFASCTQNFDLVMNVYTADDQGQSNPNFTFYNSYIIATNMTSGAQQAFLATELAPTVSRRLVRLKRSAGAGRTPRSFRLRTVHRSTRCRRTS